jgi:hypothetical protein
MGQALKRAQETKSADRTPEPELSSSTSNRKTGKIAQGWQQTLVHLPPEIKLAAKKRVLEEGTDLSVVIADLLEKWLKT